MLDDYDKERIKRMFNREFMDYCHKLDLSKALEFLLEREKQGNDDAKSKIIFSHLLERISRSPFGYSDCTINIPRDDLYVFLKSGLYTAFTHHYGYKELDENNLEKVKKFHELIEFIYSQLDSYDKMAKFKNDPFHKRKKIFGIF